jgi:hypothetical protein
MVEFHLCQGTCLTFFAHSEETLSVLHHCQQSGSKIFSTILAVVADEASVLIAGQCACSLCLLPGAGI